MRSINVEIKETDLRNALTAQGNRQSRRQHRHLFNMYSMFTKLKDAGYLTLLQCQPLPPVRDLERRGVEGSKLLRQRKEPLSCLL